MKNKKNSVWALSLLAALLLSVSISACGSANPDSKGPDQTPNPNPLPKGSLKEELIKILTQVKFDKTTSRYKSSFSTSQGTYSVQDDGKLIYQDKWGSPAEEVELYVDSGTGQYVLDHKTKGKSLFNDNKSQKDLDSLMRFQRHLGIALMKTRNPECYFQLASARLSSSDPIEMIYALERQANPRPLIFKNDEHYAQFAQEMRDLFEPLLSSSEKSHVILTGTSTTFFSQNPTKGKNTGLIQNAPHCDTSSDLYTFDTPGKSPSDLDVIVLIPRLSELCEIAYKRGRIVTTKTKGVYPQNTLNLCFQESSDKRVTDLTKSFPNFINTWKTTLGNRDINFSVEILDKYRLGAKDPSATGFRRSRHLRDRFAWEIKSP